MPSRKQKRRTSVDRSYLRRFCNLKRDPLDPRDRPYMAIEEPSTAPRIPKKVDHCSDTRPVGNQGHTGWCVGWATTHGLRRWLYYKETGTKMRFSVRFVWMSSKELDPVTPNVPFDLAGTRIRDAFKAMNKYGACPDRLWRFEKELPNPDKGARILREAMR